MHIQDLLTEQRTLNCESQECKKRVLERITELVSQDLNPIEEDNDIFDSYIARERLGSTAIGYGVAIPHIHSKWVDKPIGALMHMRQGVDFNAPDQKPVDIVFALLVPEGEQQTHLNILAKLAEQFSFPEFCEKLRNTRDNLDLYEKATETC